MHLVMFDIDGTLTETMKVDEECFVRSFKDVFDFADIDTDWSHYPRTTDSGIFDDIFHVTHWPVTDGAGGFAISPAFHPIACCRLITVSFCTGCRG
jgi:hypothetical protein